MPGEEETVPDEIRERARPLPGPEGGEVPRDRPLHVNLVQGRCEGMPLREEA